MRFTNSDKIHLMRLAVEIAKNKDIEKVLKAYKGLLTAIDKKEADRLDSEALPVFKK